MTHRGEEIVLALTRERRVSIGGLHVSVAADAARAERLRRSPFYRYLLRPGLGVLAGRANGAGGARPTIVRESPSTAPTIAVEDPEAEEIRRRIDGIGWYHTIDVGHGVSTPGFIDNRPTVPLFGLPEDLTGMRCLDIGTYDGFWAFEMERRGASEVIGIDVDSPLDHDVPRLQKLKAIEAIGDEGDAHRRHWSDKLSDVGLEYPGQGFQVAKELRRSKARREVLNVYDLSPEKLGMFDVVLISQLLLRLRDPQTIIENIYSVTRGQAIIAEAFDPELEAMPRPVSEFLGTTLMGIWWRHSVKSIRKMMEVAGFDPIEEVSRFEVENRAGRFSKVVLKGYAPSATQPA